MKLHGIDNINAPDNDQKWLKVFEKPPKKQQHYEQYRHRFDPDVRQHVRKSKMK